MRGSEQIQDAMFSYISPAQRVPQDHPLRPIRKMVDEALKELSPKFDVDAAHAAVTRKSFLERYCDTDTLCCTAHFPSPSTGKIRRSGNGFTCEAVA